MSRCPTSSLWEKQSSSGEYSLICLLCEDLLAVNRHDLDREEGRPRQFGGVGEGRGLHVLADRAALFNNRRVRRRAVQRVARRAEARLQAEF